MKDVTTLETGLSDCYEMVCFATKQFVKATGPRRITYRSFKHFSEAAYASDADKAPFHVGDIFDNVDDCYWFSMKLLQDIIDEHAPLKQKVIRHKQVPYMNSNLRKSINVKNMLHRKYTRVPSATNWEKYRRQRNLVVRLRKSSRANYIKSVGKGSSVKPLVSNKCKRCQRIWYL